ncbi:MAG: orotidine-5'-phosphate decarboxylase [Maricaulis sp.]|jgi:orotidine-5'-phosphate decarboxylase|nr:orotidine-5'-phosphate decarboxylase [Maricaulis sp.]MDG2044742.1 orotidine-5'-phosphate decarboxylase [Maricaulis sp.]
MTHLDSRLIVALDQPTIESASAIVDALGDTVSFYKIGLQLIPIGGMDLSAKLKAEGKQVFLDYKLHDIPATVEKATRSLSGVGADLVTVHAEPAVMKAAAAGRENSNLKILGVTVMTCYDDAMLTEMGYAHGARDLVLRRVEQALEAGIDGIVSSALEAAEIRNRFGDDFLIVTPGIRPAGADAGDQKRVATPKLALNEGATHLVVGRPIHGAPDPADAARSIIAEMKQAPQIA